MIDNLLHAVYHAPTFTLILTLRADFYSDALSYRPLADALQEAYFNIGPMDIIELQAAIEKPVHLCDVTPETGLTQRILTGKLSLPLLEFALTQLWSKQKAEKLTHQAYDEIGGAVEALANHAESIYAQFTPQERERSQQVFIQLVQPRQETTGIRRIAKREEIGEEN